MHASCRILIAGLLLVLLPLFAFAQVPTPPTIKLVRVGLPATGKSKDETGRSRSGAWAPVQVMLESGASGHPAKAYQLRIETTDLEDQVYQYTVPVPAMSAITEGTVMGYTVPGNDTSTFKVQLETQDERVVDMRDKLTRDVVGEHDILILAAGSGLSSLKQATEKLDEKKAKGKGKNKDKMPEAGDPPAGEEDLIRGKRQFAFIEDANALPDRWFGYDAVDVVVLATSKVDFINKLTSGDAESDDGQRRAALAEWVRRGGQLILSVGRNQQQVAELLRKMPIINCQLKGTRPDSSLSELAKFSKLPGEVLNKVEVAQLEPGEGVHEIVRESFGPVVVMASCGMGRVMLIGMDFDTGEFSNWKGQTDFWREVQSIIVPHLPTGRAQNQPWAPKGAWNQNGDEFSLRDELKAGLEDFEEVPPIHVGYVLGFLLFYILLVGPLDYFLLKKVFKRLELTWVTFPLTVIVVSVAAYFSAYAMKGNDLRVNKMDLIDIDMHPLPGAKDTGLRKAYGRSWFTLFSSRAQSYTVGIEPASGVWTDEAGSGSSVVTLLEGGDNSRRQASAALFKKPYQYAEDAGGLKYVPVPVWSTRSFVSSWSASLRKGTPPVAVNGGIEPLAASADGTALSGRLTNNLEVTLYGAVLFYRDKVYPLRDLTPGAQFELNEVFQRNFGVQGRDVKDFIDDMTLLKPQFPPLAPSGRPVGAGFKTDRQSYTQMKVIMFYQHAKRAAHNSGMRPLDQSWRLGVQPTVGDRTRYRDEAILVARAPLMCDYAKDVNTHPASASRLWLGKLPGAEEKPPQFSGVVTEETFVRVFIPVKRRR